ncbi:uncharacterized protein LOC144867496 [Branchiostoma floridae x Branchiostoma japonicum]
MATNGSRRRRNRPKYVPVISTEEQRERFQQLRAGRDKKIEELVYSLSEEQIKSILLKTLDKEPAVLYDILQSRQWRDAEGGGTSLAEDGGDSDSGNCAEGGDLTGDGDVAKGSSGGGDVAKGTGGGGDVAKGSSGGGDVAKGSGGGGDVAKGNSGDGDVAKGNSGGGDVAKGNSRGRDGAVAKGNSGGGDVAKGTSRGGDVAKGSSGGGDVAKGSSGGGDVAKGNSGDGNVAKGNSGGGDVAKGNSRDGAVAKGNSGGGDVAKGSGGGGAVAKGNSGDGDVAKGNSGGGDVAKGNSRDGAVAKGNSGGGDVVKGNSGGGAVAKGSGGGGKVAKGKKGRGGRGTRSSDNKPKWCSCGQCQKMLRGEERFCCGTDPVSCVSNLPDMEMYILDPGRLRLNRALRNDILALKDDLQDPGSDNREFRRAAYRHFLLWQYGRLGEGGRVKIPSCCVSKIRKAFPDPYGQYERPVANRLD